MSDDDLHHRNLVADADAANLLNSHWYPGTVQYPVEFIFHPFAATGHTTGSKPHADLSQFILSVSQSTGPDLRNPLFPGQEIL